MNQPQNAIATIETSERDAMFKTNDHGALLPGSLRDLIDLSNLLADSTVVPKDYIGKPGNVLVAIQMGAELGLKPMQAMQNIAVINGRPSIWGDAMLALCRSHREWGGIKEEISEDSATCTVTRIERTAGGPVPSVVTRTFSMEDAKRAGLASKDGPWKQYPKRMMQMRARAFALRDLFTDALKGFSSREEQEDMVIDVVATDVTRPPSGTAAVKEKLKAAKQPEADAVAGKEAAESERKTVEKAKAADVAATPAQATKPAGTPSKSVESWVEAFKMAETPDDIIAIRRDLQEVWGEYSAEQQTTIGAAITASQNRFRK